MRGKVWKYGDHIDTDVIIPARYLNDPDPAALASHCMSDIDESFAGSVQPGDIIVGGWNFGCGSSREHAPIAIQASGVSCVIAASFARIFYRNSINIGFPILECPEASEAIKAGDTVSVDTATGIIADETTGESFQAKPFPPFIQQIIEKGGLLAYLRQNVTERDRGRFSVTKIDARDSVTGRSVTGDGSLSQKGRGGEPSSVTPLSQSKNT